MSRHTRGLAHQNFGQLVVRDVGKFSTVEFRDNKLYDISECLHFRNEISISYGMSFAQRADVEKGKRLLRLKELHARDLS